MIFSLIQELEGWCLMGMGGAKVWRILTQTLNHAPPGQLFDKKNCYLGEKIVKFFFYVITNLM